MKRTKMLIKRLLFMSGLLIAGLFNGTAAEAAKEIPVLPTDVTTPSEGCTLVGIEGVFDDEAEPEDYLKQINQYRLEACENGYPDPRNPKRALTKADYVPVQWSQDLQYIARIRAAEEAVIVSMDHTRTNGRGGLSLKSPSGKRAGGENLGFGGFVFGNGVAWWYSEKDAWVK